MGVEQRAGEEAIGRCDVAEALDVTIKLIGTPAEEPGRDKVQRLRRENALREGLISAQLEQRAVGAGGVR